MHTRTYEVQGNKWMVDPWGLIIPEHSIEDMTPREIGEHVISLMKKAQEIRENEERDYFYGMPVVQSSIPREQRDSRYATLVRRDGNKCQVPGCLVEGPYDIDHVIPRSKGGSDRLVNLQLLCPRHNSQKRDKFWEDFLETIQE